MARWSERTFTVFSDIFGVLFILILLAAGLFWLYLRPGFLLSSIDVNVVGNKDVITAPMLAQNLKGKVVGNYFTVDIKEIMESLQEIPWVKDVSVSRKWPNRLDITLYLHKPIATWGSQELLAEDGAIFVANQAMVEGVEKLPDIYGPRADRMEIYKIFKDAQGVCSEKGFDALSLKRTENSGWIFVFKRPEGEPIKIIFKGSDTRKVLIAKLKQVIEDLPKIVAHLGKQPTELDARYDKAIAVVRPKEESEVVQEAVEKKNGR